MYDMYPEWGPAKHRTDETATGAWGDAARSLQWSLDLRDSGGQRPDDN